MAEFPTTLPSPLIGSSGAMTKAQVRTPFEGGYVQSRPKHTRKRGGPYSLDYIFTTAELATFDTFFDTNQGGSFDYSVLGTGDYRFSEDSYEWEWLEAGYYRVSVQMEEV